MVARRADIYQSAVEGREARVADVVRRVREDDRVDDRADARRGLAEAPRDLAAVLEDERRAEGALLRAEERLRRWRVASTPSPRGIPYSIAVTLASRSKTLDARNVG